jgi:flagellar biosynthesis protein FlhB
MTPREAKLERREAEGDPIVRRARREAHERLVKEG